LDDQTDAWNQVDIDRFMRHYWKSDQLSFSSEGKTLRGWNATMQRYRKRYPTPEDMGTLRFSELEVQPLGPTAGLVLGRWHLTRSGQDLEGNFSLVFRRIGGCWQIVHDHTSRVLGVAFFLVILLANLGLLLGPRPKPRKCRSRPIHSPHTSGPPILSYSLQ
jgi:ketosteroid isomerase-like protein